MVPHAGRLEASPAPWLTAIILSMFWSNFSFTFPTSVFLFRHFTSPQFELVVDMKCLAISGAYESCSNAAQLRLVGGKVIDTDVGIFQTHIPCLARNGSLVMETNETQQCHVNFGLEDGSVCSSEGCLGRSFLGYSMIVPRGSITAAKVGSTWTMVPPLKHWLRCLYKVYFGNFWLRVFAGSTFTNLLCVAAYLAGWPLY
jgi:hypothetical protein